MLGRANMAPATFSSDDATEHATPPSSHGPQLPPLRRISTNACVHMLLLHQSPVQTDASDSFFVP